MKKVHWYLITSEFQKRNSDSPLLSCRPVGREAKANAGDKIGRKFRCDPRVSFASQSYGARRVHERKRVPILVIVLSVLSFFAPPGRVLIFAQGDKPKPLDLDETKWEIMITSFDAKGKKKTTNDTLTFEDNQVIAKGFEKQGYTPTNYSLSVKEDGTTVFKTMQIGKPGTAFWQGDVFKGGTMTGSVTVSPTKGDQMDSVFDGKLVSGILKPQEEKVEVQSQVPQAVTEIK